MATDLKPLYLLPLLIDGRRYSHELQDPTPIPSDKCRSCLGHLHKFHDAVVDNAPTLSEASGTSVAAESEASAATSMTERTSTFSANNGPVQQERTKKPLGDVQRTRKALLRKLGACAADCRKRKVKCPLWHHALRDLLKIEHTEYDEEVVEWAIRYDAELQSPGLTPTASTRVTQFASGNDVEERSDVMARFNGAFNGDFNLDPSTPMPYGDVITETSASLLDGSVEAPSQPIATQDTVYSDLPAPKPYSVFRHDLLWPLGSREPNFDPAHYSCWFGDCHEILPLPEIMHHFQDHLPFGYLDDPLRMVCPHCDTFYSYSTDECLGCSVLSGGLVEKVYGNFSDATTMSMPSERVTVQPGPSFFDASETQSVGGYLYQNSSSTPLGYDYYQNNYNSGCSGVGYFSYTKSVIVDVKRSFLKTAATLLRFSNAAIRRRRYVATLVAVAVVSIIYGFKNHEWLLSNLIRLTRGISMVSPSKLPPVGVVIASMAFALHRIIVHATRANNICSGWLSRCALSAFNVACGRQPLEWLGTAGYGLGHERS